MFGELIPTRVRSFLVRSYFYFICWLIYVEVKQSWWNMINKVISYILLIKTLNLRFSKHLGLRSFLNVTLSALNKSKLLIRPGTCLVHFIHTAWFNRLEIALSTIYIQIQCDSRNLELALFTKYSVIQQNWNFPCPLNTVRFNRFGTCLVH